MDDYKDLKEIIEKQAALNQKLEAMALPCKIGDTVYQTDGIRIYESKIKRIMFDTDNIAFDERAIGSSIFLTREEAEAALKGAVECTS